MIFFNSISDLALDSSVIIIFTSFQLLLADINTRVMIGIHESFQVLQALFLPQATVAFLSFTHT